MFFAKQFISRSVVTAFPEQRLAYLSEQIISLNAQHCAVIKPRTYVLVGVVRFSHIAANPDTAGRIFADLMQPPPPLAVNEFDSLETVIDLLVAYDPTEVVVAEKTGEFIGLITPESFARWLLSSRFSLEFALSKFAASSRWHPAPPTLEDIEGTG